MHTSKLALALGALLSTGMLVAQAPDQPQSTPAQQKTTPAETQSAQAQAEGPHGMHHRNRQMREMEKKLNLSKDKVAQIKPILADRRQQMQALRTDASLSEQDRRAKMRGVAEDSRTKIEGLLTSEQKQQFEQMLAKRRAHRHEQPPQG